ncbi:DUF5776 domain-containing protein [Lentilactobacillus sp. SPB1-3]|uniref:DUF5776 domain-containing protein n=1 Tax=Lentilactobacillus terminaliae TaxID=3003483 RepID=A0ACD5DCB1_9LACO|nr:DUF5776 domain-containing protein [Lentilactobacillus sp. SPB1-3]MCZ0977144.1 DUF5776 domain-containing protein [Lentilactobacillus sp. SPB1-3]
MSKKKMKILFYSSLLALSIGASFGMTKVSAKAETSTVNTATSAIVQNSNLDVMRYLTGEHKTPVNVDNEFSVELYYTFDGNDGKTYKSNYGQNLNDVMSGTTDKYDAYSLLMKDEFKPDSLKVNLVIKNITRVDQKLEAGLGLPLYYLSQVPNNYPSLNKFPDVVYAGNGSIDYNSTEGSKITNFNQRFDGLSSDEDQSGLGRNPEDLQAIVIKGNVTPGGEVQTSLPLKYKNIESSFKFSKDELDKLGDSFYMPINIGFPSLLDIRTGITGSHNILYVAPSVANPATVNVGHVDESGNPIGTNEELKAWVGDSLTIPQAKIDGYELDTSKDNPTSYQTTQNDTETPANITLHYKKMTNSGGGSTGTNNPSTGGGAITSPTQPSQPSTPVQPSQPVLPTPNVPGNDSTGLPNWAAVKGQSVYGIKGFYLYKNANFNRGQHIKYYSKTSRVNRPQFIVKGYKHDNNGNLRYKVQQYNPYKGKYVAGTKGYITASEKYVVKAYYATTPKNKRIKVINKNGVKSYQNVKLSGKAKLYKKGSTLKVKSIKKYKLATRYQLTNGQYVTGNKKFIIWK